ncbi:type II toxin-antitoxin system RelE/ParE family toxin [Nitrosomonas sp. Is24]|uniref:type II toxin-antitoxin system RelE family toxin n=1 Tax=Nitrosomonas sp. Is24 TaxID=3080533 RepID=UPI00294B05DB|nr:type II toxin-antitoxin system RelE/ParE family toxin [Nitrosomonas sp. Is24]MDV6342383.1 type II toxin-antitoxin system RelE/ParE family toxin [Nitrosomonas sp. Is24]
MKYHIEFTPQALEDLSQLDLPVAKRIIEKIEWLAGHFDEIQPETLTGSLANLYKLRVGDWRALYTAQSEHCVITIHVIAHRRKVYKM